MISIDGSNNIIIQGIYESIVTVNYNDIDEIEKHIKTISSIILQESKEALKSELQLTLNELEKFRTRKIFPDSLTNLPYISNEDVYGRENVIMELKGLLDEEDKIVLLNGIGGIGKTTVAKVFINNEKHLFNHICWIEILDNVKEAFVYNLELIDSLGLSSELEHLVRGEEFTNKAFNLILNRLRQLRGKNLLIIDNASDEIEDLVILNKIALRPYWKVIVTSREILEGFKIYELQALKQNDALDLFYHHYKYEQNNYVVSEILDLISYHTLSIEIIAKTGEKRMLKLYEILDIIKKKISNISAVSKDIKIYRNQNKPIIDYASFLASIFPLSKMTYFEKWILYQFAIMPPIHISYRDSTIGMNLTEMLQIPPDRLEKEFPDSLSNLVDLGWLKKQDYGFIIHSIIQEVVIIQEGIKISYSEELISFLGNKLDEAFIKDKLSGLPILQYVDRIYSIYETLDNNSLGSLYNNASVIYEDALGDYKKSLFFNHKAIEIHSKTGSELQLSISYNSLATTYRLVGNIDVALEYGMRALEIREKNKEDRPSYLGNTYQTLSIIYRKKNMLQEALEFAVKAIKIREKLSKEPEKDKRIAKLYNNISIIYRTVEDFDNAILYANKSIEIKEKYYPEDKLSLSTSFSTMAITLLNAGKAHEGHKFAKMDLEICQELLNPNHPFLAITYNTLALINFQLTDFSKALLYNKEELSILQANFDTSNFDYQEALNLNKKILERLEQLQ